MTRPDTGFTPLRFTARDGLSLYACRYGERLPGRLPVLCLPGLTRNSRDFHVVAHALAAAGHAVYTLDSRGRGGSEHDPDWKNYTVANEAQDVLDFIVAHDLAGAGILGTSRGGLIAFAIAALRPTALGPVVLNDIGPVIETAGLARIGTYVGKVPTPATWEEATAGLARYGAQFFPAVPAGEWSDVARQWYNEADGRPAPAYDPNLAKSFAESGTSLPDLWPQFGALAHVPVLVLRGETSDLLSPATVEEMCKRHPRCRAHTVPGQGHAPLLRDAGTNAAIAAFFAATAPSGH